MTRKSRRELEDALASMDDEVDPDASARVRAGVTAEFVTFADEEGMTEEDLPDGWTVSTTTIRDATFHVAERIDDGRTES